MPPELTFSPPPLSLASLVVNLALGWGLALVLRWYYLRFATTLSNRSEFSNVFPLLVMATILIISVVKSSLALSLGLVGALSIVRFRTPIKEPEELVFLFMAIAIGLGLGADYRWETLTATAVILVLVTLYRYFRKDRMARRLFLCVSHTGEEGSPPTLEQLQSVVGQHTTATDLRRLDSHGTVFEATFYVDLADGAHLGPLTEALRGAFPGVGVTFIDQQQTPVL